MATQTAYSAPAWLRAANWCHNLRATPIKSLAVGFLIYLALPIFIDPFRNFVYFCCAWILSSAILPGIGAIVLWSAALAKKVTLTAKPEKVEILIGFLYLEIMFLLMGFVGGGAGNVPHGHSPTASQQLIATIYMVVEVGWFLSIPAAIAFCIFVRKYL